MTDRLANAWRSLLEALDYDPVHDPHLSGTPQRVARFLREWSTWARPAAVPKLTTFPANGYSQVVAVGGIRFHSMCAHHGLPFIGTAAVGYLPKDRIVGLSKLARLVDYYSRRFTVQEEITRLVADHLDDALRPAAVGVVLRAEHLCMSMRGIQRPGHFTITSDLRGVFRRDAAARAELLRLVEER